MSEVEPKFKKIVMGADSLSLGISIVVAVLFGVGIGLLLKNLTGLWMVTLGWCFLGGWSCDFKCL